MRDVNLSGLFIFEMANNHQGRVEHGLHIIEQMARVAHANGVRAAVKLQMRHLESFIHPAHRKGSSNKHVDRFLSTRLSHQDLEKLVQATHDAGLISMCTPFDERSVGGMQELGVQVAKIGSPSAQDWPLIEEVVETGLPVVCATGGLAIKEVDDLVSFFDHRKVQHALMHCVSIYPTPLPKLNLGQVKVFRERYRGTTVGYSGHEHPDELLPIQIAVAMGGTIFERHVGVETDDIKLNAYSMNPAQVDRWLKAAKVAEQAVGALEPITEADPQEVESLSELRRGVYARRNLKSNVTVERGDVYFAMPAEPDQLTPDLWTEGIVTRRDVGVDVGLTPDHVDLPPEPASQRIFTAIHTIKAMLNEARIALPSDFELEISHHYGMENFEKTGTVIIDCINRDYCKKILVQLPGQMNPLHYHLKKEETFQVLSGVLELDIDDRRRTLHPGDTAVVMPGVWHSFWSDTGAIFEEVSTTHYNDDSYYADKALNKMHRSERKTVVRHWGRNQIPSS